MAHISLQAPLLFIDGPPMATIVQFTKEESTSIYWSGNDPEVIEEIEQSFEIEQSYEDVLTEQIEEITMDSRVVKKLRYLAEPFPRTAYRPLQFLVNGQLLTGDISGMTDTEIALEVKQESKDMNEIRTLDLHEIEEVFWKGSPFT